VSSGKQIAVRMSPEGMSEVIAMFRRVGAEGKRVQADAGKGVNVVTAALRDLKALIPVIGIAGVVGGFAALSRNSLKAADDIGKITQAVGGTAEEVSALSLAFRQNDSNQEGARTALEKTAKVLGDVRAGSQDAIDALAQIGVNARELTQLNTPRALEQIARKLVEIEDPAQRFAAAQKIFGRNAQDMIVALNAVGSQGIDPFIARARELGVLIDDDLAEAAARARDALATIQVQAEGIATQFVSGFAPEIADAMETISQAVTSDGTNVFREFGGFVGFVLRGLTFGLVDLGNRIGAFFASTMATIRGFGSAGLALIKGDLEGARAALKQADDERAAIRAALEEDFKALEAKFEAGPLANKPPSPRDRRGAGAGGDDPDGALSQLRKLQAARLSLRQQQIQAELQLQQERIRAEEQANDDLYAANLLSLQEYFDRRRALLLREFTAEVQALKQQRATLAAQLATPEKKGGPENEEARARLRQQIAQVDAELARREVVFTREVVALQSERQRGAEQLANQQSQQQQALLLAEGKRHAAFELNLAAEIRQLEELGVRAGQTVEQIEAQVARLRAARTNQFDFEEVTRRAGEELDAFSRDAAQIRNDLEAGIITQFEAEERLIKLQRERLVVLKAIAAAALKAAEATGSQDAIEKARQYADSVDEISVSLRQATDVVSQVRSGGINSLSEGIASLVGDIDKIDSVGDAFWRLAETVSAALQEIAEQIIRRQIALALANIIPTGGGAGGAAVPGARRGGQVKGYAGGGDVRGPRLNIAGPDKIPALLQEEEFVLRRARVREPGALAFLRAWNSGQITLAQALGVPRFADGGMVGSIASAGMAPAAPQGGRPLVEKLFVSVPGDRNGKVSGVTLLQTQAAVARGLSDAARRNN
jgi:hypothetical protein